MSEFKNQLKDSQKCENIDDIADVYFMEPLGLLFARLFVKLHIKPNAVTLLSCFIGVSGAILFAFDNLILNAIGIFLVLLGGILDCSDGQVARLTHSGSEFGRKLDGLCDGIIYFAIYVCICIRLMDTFIPFTDIKWSFWIFPVFIVMGFLFHNVQARTADRIRNLHMFFYKNSKGSELSRSKNLAIQYKNKQCSWFERLLDKTYLQYTKSEEKMFPNTEKLLNKLEKYETIPDEIRDYYYKESKKHILWGNCLTYNLRTFILFFLIMFRLEIIIVLVNLLFLETIKGILIIKYERIAKKCLIMVEKYEE